MSHLVAVAAEECAKALNLWRAAAHMCVDDRSVVNVEAKSDEIVFRELFEVNLRNKVHQIDPYCALRREKTNFIPASGLLCLQQKRRILGSPALSHSQLPARPRTKTWLNV